MSELTSIILISCFELSFVGRFICHVWRIFFDNQLSMVLTKLEAIHEKLIRLKVVGPMKIKMNRYIIIGIILNGITYVITPPIWMILQTQFEYKTTVGNH